MTIPVAAPAAPILMMPHILAANLMLWEAEEGAHGVGITWSDGRASAYPLSGWAWPERETLRVSQDDGLKVLGAIIGTSAFRHAGRYRMGGDRRHVLELPTVIFEWFGEEDARASIDPRR